MDKNLEVKSVVGFAREVRLRMRDSRVIFATVLDSGGRGADAFTVRAWGVKLPMTVSFGDVSQAAAVKTMLWKQHCDISAAQLAGTFLKPPRIVSSV